MQMYADSITLLNNSVSCRLTKFVNWVAALVKQVSLTAAFTGTVMVKTNGA